MIKSILTLIFCLWASCAGAFPGSFLAMSTSGVAGSCAKGTTIFSETFEAIADGEELSVDNNWDEQGASTDIFVGDNALAHGGSISGKMTEGAAGLGAYRLFTEVLTGKFTVDLWFAPGTITAAISNAIVLSDSAISVDGNRRVVLATDSSGNLQIMDNATATTVAALSANTFTHIEVEVDTDITTGVNAVRVWIGGTEHASSPFDTKDQTNPAGIDRVGAMSDVSAGGSTWWDDVLTYQGARCEN